MADVLKLATDDYTDETSKVDLLGGRWRLRRGAFSPKAATDPTKPVTETIELLAEGTPAQIAAGEEMIEGALELASRYSSQPMQKLGRWLEWQTDGEPGAGTPGAY